MTPEQIEIARKAMALPGAPRMPFSPTPSQMVEVSPDRAVVVWNLADTTRAGWALGGVLLGALGDDMDAVCYRGGSAPWQADIAGPDVLGCQWVDCPTLSESCCRVAIANGCWPGGLKHD